ILPISHDEVVHGKGSMIEKMPGNEWEKFANLRAYYGFMWGHPGKKLLFMGCEFGQWSEWNHDVSLDWDALHGAHQRGAQALVRDLNHLYRDTPALHRRDCEPSGFRWIANDPEQSLMAFARFGEDGDAPVVVVCNFTPVERHWRIGLPLPGAWEEVLNTDAGSYGGGDRGTGGQVQSEDGERDGLPQNAEITVPPLATLIFRHIS
ncbi:MAG: alpha amylase C-terminal domain-containing protein, partial [Pseudomonadota bacterium]